MKTILLFLCISLSAFCQYKYNPLTGKLDRVGISQDANGNLVIGTTAISPTAGIMLPVSKVSAASTNAVLGTRYLCDRVGCTFVLPAAAVANSGGVACARNYTGRAGAIVFQLPATTVIDVDGTAYAATVTSSSEAGASACVQVTAAGEYFFFGGKGTWTGAN